MARAWADPAFFEDLGLLLRGHHPVLWVETEEYDRVEGILAAAAERAGVLLRTWDAHHGLRVTGSLPGGVPALGAVLDLPVPGTEALEGALRAVTQEPRGVTAFRGLAAALESPKAIAQFVAAAKASEGVVGALVGMGPAPKFPPELLPYVTVISLPPASLELLRQYVRSVLQDLHARSPVQVQLSQEETARFLRAVQGLPLAEVRRVVARVVADDGRLDALDIDAALANKRDALAQSGLLELYATGESLADVAGLGNLKAWLQKRREAFVRPEAAAAFGVTPPRGLLLVGVQGAGKSLSAKAVAADWGLPLVRFDPANLFDRYFGESEKNLRRAMKLAEAMAPVVLWIDEIEKVFARTGDDDGGTGARLFGSFLTWMNEKKASVFVVATANEVQSLPPELLRKGRFDEIFFLDLPGPVARRSIFEVHLVRRSRDPRAFDLDALAAATEGWSGAEIEQAVVSALYGAFAQRASLTTEAILAEVHATKPLSVTMAEQVEALRAWAKTRAVPASAPEV